MTEEQRIFEYRKEIKRLHIEIAELEEENHKLNESLQNCLAVLERAMCKE